MKTPEELAEEWIETNGWNTEPFRDEYIIEFKKEGYVAGYQAARDHVVDVNKMMPDTCEHILDMSKMVDVSSSETLNNSSNNSNGWISVKDRLPEEQSGLLIVYHSYLKEVGTSYYDDDMWCSSPWPITSDEYITHWMPLPKPPEDK